MNNTLVSVIMTNYNYDRFLEEAINGVINQTYENWEFIIVDDGSTDNSGDIIKKYAEKEPRIKYIFKENGGQCDSFNQGYAISKGEIIALLDSDDYYYPHMLERKVAMHEKGGIVDSALSRDGIKPMISFRQNLNWAEIFRETGYVYRHNNTSGLSVSRKCIDKFLPLTETKTLYGGLDEAIICIAMMECDVVIDDFVCGFYREHSEHSSKNRKNFYDDMYRDVRLIRQYCIKQINNVYPDFKHEYEEYLIKILGNYKEKNKIEKVVFYGTGILSCALSIAAEIVDMKIVYYSESNSDNWGKKFNDILILSPKDLHIKRNEFDKIVIASCQSKEIVEYLISEGFDCENDILVLPI